MATVTGLTAERMLDIEGKSVIDGDVVGDNLILTKYNGQTINAGNVRGPQGTPGTNGTNGAMGPQGPPGIGSIPGEMRMWSGKVLPPQATYGLWVWANGDVYPVASYPIAAANIAPEWRVFAGASDPGAANFRVPDLRGLVPVGMDQMPGGSRANRMTRVASIVIARTTGEETHVIQMAEMPYHDHGGGIHQHSNMHTGHENYEADYPALVEGKSFSPWNRIPSNNIGTMNSAAIIAPQGGNNAHENVQPSVFVPYIICLHG